MTRPAADKWIEIVGWDRFQHYTKRRPTWIKLYTDLLDNEDYLSLTRAERCLLMELWMLYARTGGNIRATSKQLRSGLRATTYQRQLESLNRAGFIRFRASRPLAGRYPRDRDRKDLKSMGIEDLLKDLPNG